MTKVTPFQKICIFGGAFDPIHTGHLKVAEQASILLAINRFIWVPTFSPPHKEPSRTPYHHRLKMVRLAISGNETHRVSDIESKLSQPSYTLDTISALKKQYAQTEQWFFLMGADNWTIFRSWYKWDKLLEEIKIIIFPRENHQIKDIPRGVTLLKTAVFTETSTVIRENLKKEVPLDKAGILPNIKDYILEHKLYGT
ncbi:nicotinate (nicotinamide) nucleotide adenylyltransferase [Fibrobacterota bacterium]